MRNLKHRREQLGPTSRFAYPHPTPSRPSPSRPSPSTAPAARPPSRPRSHLSVHLQRLLHLASTKRTIGLVNLLVILLFFYNCFTLLLRNPYHQHSPLPESASPNHHPHTPAFPGYVDVRDATFRSKYPSVSMAASGTFDAIYVLTNRRCPSLWDHFETLADRHNLSVIKWPLPETRSIRLDNPPMPLVASSWLRDARSNRAVAAILKRHLAYTFAHRSLWRQVIDLAKQRVLVLDDSLFPTDRMIRSLPGALSNVDQESVVRRQKWHLMFLRRVRVSTASEPVWTINEQYGHPIVHAGLSQGMGAYVLTLHGAQFLWKHVTRFRAPLDAEIGLVQREHPDHFVALSACNNHRVRPLCPEMVRELGGLGGSLDCAWRRAHELHDIQRQLQWS